MSASVKHASGTAECPFNATGSKAVSSGWDRAHGRLWDEDQKRMAYLDREIRKERFDVQRRQTGDGQRAWRKKALKENPPSPCFVCGGPRNGWTGLKCMSCRNDLKCRGCGLVQAKWRRDCRDCGAKLTPDSKPDKMRAKVASKSNA